MFLRDRHPRFAIHLLCNAAAGCSVAGLALLAEERRRRIALAQRIVENGRRLQAYKAYHGNAAIAVFENDVAWSLEPHKSPDPQADPPRIRSNGNPIDALSLDEWRSRGRSRSSLPTSVQLCSHRDAAYTPEHAPEPFPMERWRTRMQTHDDRSSLPDNSPRDIASNKRMAPQAPPGSKAFSRRLYTSDVAGQRILSDERVKRARAVHKIQMALKDGIKARLVRAACEEERLKAYAELYYYFALHKELVSAPLRSFVDHLRGHKGNRSVMERNGKTWQMLPHDMRAVIEEGCTVSRNSRSKASQASKVAMDLQDKPASIRQSTLAQHLSHLITSHRPDEAYLALTMACSSLVGPIEPALRSCARLIIDTYKSIGCSTLVLELHKTLSLVAGEILFWSYDLCFLLGQESDQMRLHICQTFLNGSLPGMPVRPAMPAFLEASLQWLLDHEGCEAAAYVFTRLSTGRIPVSHNLLERVLPGIGQLIKQRAQDEAKIDLSDSIARILESYGMRRLRHAASGYFETATTGSPRQMQRALAVMCQALSSENIHQLVSKSVHLQECINSTHTLLLKRIWALTNNYALLEELRGQIKSSSVYSPFPHDIQHDIATRDILPVKDFKRSLRSLTTSSRLILAKAHCQDWVGVEADLQERQTMGFPTFHQLHHAGVFEDLIQAACNQNRPQVAIHLATSSFRRYNVPLTSRMCQKITHSLVNEEQIGPCAQWLDFCASSDLDINLADDTLRLVRDRLGLVDHDMSKPFHRDQNDPDYKILHLLEERAKTLRRSTIPQTPLTYADCSSAFHTSTTGIIDYTRRAGTLETRRHFYLEAEKILSHETSLANSTMRAMRRKLAAGEPSKALDIYTKSLIDQYPLRPHLLSTAAEILTILHGTSANEVTAMVQAAEQQGLCISRARRTINLQVSYRESITEDAAKQMIFDDYESTEILGRELDHVVFYAVLQRLSKQDQPDAVLRICKEVRSSRWGKQKPYNNWLVTNLMRLFIVMNYEPGMYWVHDMVCQSMRPSRQYLVTLRQARSKTHPVLLDRFCKEIESKRTQQKARSRSFLEDFATLLRR